MKASSSRYTTPTPTTPIPSPSAFHNLTQAATRSCNLVLRDQTNSSNNWYKNLSGSTLASTAHNGSSRPWHRCEKSLRVSWRTRAGRRGQSRPPSGRQSACSRRTRLWWNGRCWQHFNKMRIVKERVRSALFETRVNHQVCLDQKSKNLTS